jgi:hypothetical protein
MNKKRSLTIGIVFLLFVSGCATLPEKLQPSLGEKYGAINAQQGIFIEKIDDKNLSWGIYGYKGDIRVAPGKHIIEAHYNSPGIAANYSGGKLPLEIEVKEGVRYYIAAEIKREKEFLMNVPKTWRPIVVKEEEIEGYWSDRVQEETAQPELNE